MKTILVVFLIVSLAMAATPPISQNDKNWVRNSADKTDCRSECASHGGHVCAGLHKSVCCDKHWCVKDEKLYDVWNCRKGLYIKLIIIVNCMLDHVMMLLREMQDFYKLINEQKLLIIQIHPFTIFKIL